MDFLPDFWRGSSRKNSDLGLGRLHRQIDSLFDQMVDQMMEPIGGFENSPVFRPSLDVEDVGDHFLVNLDLPGVKKEDIDIEVRANQLVISAERKSESEQKKKGVFRSERFYGTFYRALPLPEGVKAEDIQCEYRDGVLKFAIPKREGQIGSKKVKIGEAKSGFFDKLLRKAESKEPEQPEKKNEVA